MNSTEKHIEGSIENISEVRSDKILTAKESARFLLEAEKSKYGIIFEFALETGLRPKEYLSLQWSDIDFGDQTVTVGERTIRLSTNLREKLKAHRTNQNLYLSEIRRRIERHAKPSREHRKERNRQRLFNHKTLNLVFASQDFTRIVGINLNERYFKKLTKNAGINDPHSLFSLRRTALAAGDKKIR